MRASLSDLGVVDDPGTDWHPRPDKAEAWGEHGELFDLDDDQVAEHQMKPEAVDQVDAGVEPLAAEDSALSPEGQV